MLLLRVGERRPVASVRIHPILRIRPTTRRSSTLCIQCTASCARSPPAPAGVPLRGHTTQQGNGRPRGSKTSRDSRTDHSLASERGESISIRQRPDSKPPCARNTHARARRRRESARAKGTACGLEPCLGNHHVPREHAGLVVTQQRGAARQRHGVPGIAWKDRLHTALLIRLRTRNNGSHRAHSERVH
jgi:hypothetical protein